MMKDEGCWRRETAASVERWAGVWLWMILNPDLPETFEQTTDGGGDSAATLRLARAHCSGGSRFRRRYLPVAGFLQQHHAHVLTRALGRHPER